MLLEHSPQYLDEATEVNRNLLSACPRLDSFRFAHESM
jgi:hypothetical protein